MSAVELTWKNLILETKTNKRILDDVSGQVSPGTITAIIGPSGSGKTTLLNSLAGRNTKTLTLEGEILANGNPRDTNNWSKTIAYVNQQLIAFDHQTVYETLKFAADAKLSEDEDTLQEIENTINMLSLQKIRDSTLSTLSGGERMKLAIGIEYLGNPSILFLDEPTSGLDSSSALNILDILQKLSKLNKTIVLTIHQPSYEMLQKINKLILMTAGVTVFDGSIKDCIDFFDEAGFKIPKNTNPATFFLDTIDINATYEDAKKITRVSIFIQLTGAISLEFQTKNNLDIKKRRGTRQEPEEV
ncbi:uncharacterized protein LOC143922182 [Arctopsyche grandis]|uniref:uncharacterized protein LOC143922182 n=1 Tax=Arctopsyche grandis TaxID=121162 RepID=UPI00406D6632